MAASLAGKAGTGSSMTSYLAPAKCAALFFLVLEWLKVREGGDVTPLKEILCNREQIAILLGGGGGSGG